MSLLQHMNLFDDEHIPVKQMHAHTRQHTYQNEFLTTFTFLKFNKAFLKQTFWIIQSIYSISKILYQVKSVEISNMDISLNIDLL